MTIQSTSSEDNIHLLNYGIIFQKQPQLYLSREYWLHTFQVKLPSNITIEAVPIWHATVQACQLLITIIFHVNVMKENTITFVHKTLMEIFNIVPESNLNFNKRKL